ncbi:M23 family metallopeptidase [Neobacillus kokaensis]|uniref:Stage II sporulation protein Q n=1 Tax=Neobacillus kokaensis TaxID=2759023 RepID=A0ABQ3N3U2_9BACI|nr:M23 family metallopeptidase [Neobacillus kokaensis]GHH98751.1 stage II sporulation protein Q [Neobacillus kokaensis]
MREENKRSSQDSKVKRFFKKRWVFPAIYIASAAIILTGVLWYQSAGNNTDKYNYKSSDLTGKKNPPAVEVNKGLENFKMPVAKTESAVIKTKFYDFNAKAEEREAALVFYNNTYQTNTGIDITMPDGKSFDVTASLSGTVTRVDDQDAVLGNVIVIEHANGIVTQYQSVKEIKVKEGDVVKQGDVLAKAGQSLFNEKAGTHVHFEIRKDGVAVNPSNFFDKPVSALMEAQVSNEKKPMETPKSDEKQLDNSEKSNSDGTSVEDDKSVEDEKTIEDDKSTDGDESTDDSQSPSDDESTNSTTDSTNS